MGKDKVKRTVKWPEKHGFIIGGYGPCYVLKVMSGSAADKQGLKIGDQIIELDKHRVGQMAAPALESFAKHIHTLSPVIKVVYDVQRIQLSATRKHGFGLSLQYSQRHGCLVESIDDHGPAYSAGLREGDLVLEVNGEAVYEKPKVLATLQKTSTGKAGTLTLSVLPINMHPKQSSDPLSGRANGRRLNKNVRHLRDKMNSLFNEDYEKRMALISILRNFSETGNAEKLAKSLVAILRSPSHRKIIPYIRLYIPIGDRPVFDHVIQRSLGKTYSEDRMVHPAESVVTDYNYTSQSHSDYNPNRLANSESQSSLLYLRSLMVHKGSGDTGVILRGHDPVIIEAVLPNTAAERGGVLKGDCILKIDGQSVVHSSHQDIQRIMKSSGSTMKLEVMQPVGMSATTASADILLSNHGTYSTTSTLHVRQPPAHHPTDAPVFDYSIYDTISSRYSLFSGHSHDHSVIHRPETQINGAEVSPHSRYHDSSSRVEFDGNSGAGNSSTLNSHRTASHSNLSAPYTSFLEDGTHGPGSYKAQVNYLLDKREKKLFKEYLLSYNNDKNIGRFVDHIGNVLDTPAKRTLWSFILPKLSTEHREYTLRTVSLPEGVLSASASIAETSAATSNRRNRVNSKQSPQTASSSALSHVVQEASPDIITAFKSQLDYLLTSDERREVKKVLHQYQSNKNVEMLVDKLNALLDTQSKKALWIHILTLLRPSHQKYVRKKIALPRSYLRGDIERSPQPSSSKGKQAASRRNRIFSQSDDEFFVVGDNSNKDVIDSAPFQNGYSDYEVPDAVRMLKYETRGSYASGGRSQRLPGADYFMENPLYGGVKSAALSDSQIDMGAVDSGIPAYDTITLPQNWSNSYKRGRQNSAFVKRSAHNDYPPHDPRYNKVVDEIKHFNGLHHVADGSSDSDDVSRPTSPTTNGGGPDTSYGSDQLYIRQKAQALEALDEAVAGLHGGDTNRSVEDHNHEVKTPPVFVPPPPPPAPPPPPPAPPLLQDNPAPFQVKRLNWEAHRPEHIDDTIWAQGSDSELDIKDLLDDLQLSQKFSTENKNAAPLKKQIIMKTRKKILDEKKALNTSIVLASLKLSNCPSATARHEHVERALLQADVSSDDTEHGMLTPHLIKQLLQYAPDDSEEVQFNNYKGDIEDLCEVDRFGYRMTKLPGYKDRLRSFLFKATFDEKCSQVQKQLHIIKAASDQIRESRAFARILEFILVMGNNLNKATNKPIAAAFKLSSLTKLDSTKTTDKKKTFLDMLVQVIHKKSPDLLTISEELDLVPAAEKATVQEISRDISELQSLLRQTSATINHLTTAQKHYSEDDRFQEVMEHFVNEAEDKIQELVRLRADSSDSFDSLLRYLGEKPNSMDSRSLFTSIQTFLRKFDTAQKLYASELDGTMSPRSPTSDVYQYL